MKDVIYWSAEAWEKIRPSTLRKAWTKILNAVFVEGDEVDHHVNNNTLQRFFKRIPGCEEVLEEDVEAWITGDNNELELTDADIADCVLHPTRADEENETEEESAKSKIPYDDAFVALEKSLEFIELQPGVTTQDILTFRKWRNFVAEKRQTSITEFFFKP